MSAIKLVSLNIEREKHLERFVPFLHAEAADVICLQEVFIDDLLLLERELGMHAHFAPMVLYARNDDVTVELEPEGVAILTREPLRHAQKQYYATGGRTPGHIVPFQKVDQSTIQHVLLSGVIGIGTQQWRVGTTHFTWTPDGQANGLQRQHIGKLLEALGQHSNIVFCGDFNAPRGREIFSQLADAYTDWLPPAVTTTLDPELHKVKRLQLVVDSIFSTPHYEVRDVRVVDGVSDHCAIVGMVQASKVEMAVSRRQAVGTA